MVQLFGKKYPDRAKEHPEMEREGNGRTETGGTETGGTEARETKQFIENSEPMKCVYAGPEVMGRMPGGDEMV